MCCARPGTWQRSPGPGVATARARVCVPVGGRVSTGVPMDPRVHWPTPIVPSPPVSTGLFNGSRPARQRPISSKINIAARAAFRG